MDLFQAGTCAREDVLESWEASQVAYEHHSYCCDDIRHHRDYWHGSHVQHHRSYAHLNQPQLNATIKGAHYRLEGIVSKHRDSGYRRMNEMLEAMARAIFKNWFLVHVDAFSRSCVSDLITSGIMAIGDGYRAKNNEMGTPGLPFTRAGELNNGFDTHGAEVLHERSVLAARDKLSRIGDVAFTYFLRR